jgi:Skp family chaperone for outer membrane proteins
MAMMRAALLLLSVSFLLSACDKFPDPYSLLDKPAGTGTTGSKTAILDIDALAEALGRDEVAKQQLQAAEQQLRQQLTEFSTSLQSKLNEEKAKLGSEPSADERQRLQEQLLQAQRQVQQSQLLAREKAAQFQTQLAVQFRKEVRPVAAEIARQRGASTVMPASSLLWFDTAVDITGAVIDAMRAKGAAVVAPAPVVPASSDDPAAAEK